MAGLAASVVLAVLATAAVAHGDRSAAPVLPALTRVAAPDPMPAGVATPVTEAPPAAPKPRVRVKVAPPPTSSTTTTTAPAPAAPVFAAGPEIPDGKGMWIWEPQRSDMGDVGIMVTRARFAGLTHIFVRTGSTWDGFTAGPFLDRLLPVAHQVGLKVYGWDFPKLSDAKVDVDRAVQALTYTAPGGDRIDGFAADIETKSEGTQFTPDSAWIYTHYLRDAVGPSTLLIGVVPNPTAQMRQKYDYDAVVGPFDALAPMVYWLNREPGLDVAIALDYLRHYGKPLMPIGQAYNGAPEGGRPGVPPPAELLRFMEVAKNYGATAVSFWSWQEANDPAWKAITSAPQFVAQPKADPKTDPKKDSTKK